MIRIFINNKKRKFLKLQSSVGWFDLSGHMSQATGPSGFGGSLADWKCFFFEFPCTRVDLDTIVLYEDMLFDVFICIEILHWLMDAIFFC